MPEEHYKNQKRELQPAPEEIVTGDKVDRIAAEQRLARAERFTLVKRLAEAMEENRTLRKSLSVSTDNLALETRERERIQTALREVFDSRSWRLTAPLRWVIMAAHAFLSGLRGQKAAQFGKVSIVQDALLKESISSVGDYETETRAKAAFVASYAENPSRQKRRQIARLLSAHPQRRGVILCPVAYDASLKQRPDHIMAEFTRAGYLCVMLHMDDAFPVIYPKAGGVFVSNMFDDFFAFFRFEPVTIYLHWPGFRYLAEFCSSAYTIYDVLDDLKIFRGYSDVMQHDHEVLIQTANLVVFSSKDLLTKNQNRVASALLLENGVYPEDFRNGSRDGFAIPAALRELAETRKVVGYHGTISDLLDFDLLDEVVRLSNVAVLFVGPVLSFDPKNELRVQERITRLRGCSNFFHIGAKSYSELKHYLAWIDVGILPLVVSAMTDSILPLKLFEFLAAGKPVVGTPTRMLNHFESVIAIKHGADFVEAIAQESWSNTEALEEVLRQHQWSALHAPLLELVNSRCIAWRAAKHERAEITVDIVNVNFFDSKGETVYKGGAERYVYDLAVLLRSMGCRVRLLQNAATPFVREFRGFKVHGFPGGATHDFGAMSNRYAEECGDADLVIASPTELAASLDRFTRVISINHGVHWDWTSNKLTSYDHARYDQLFKALRNSDRCVCVDTNFINWLRTYDWALANTLTYIPNYVDLETFKAHEKKFDDDEVRVLLPRRLYEARGLYLTINAFDILFERRSDLRLVLCGQASGTDADAIRDFLARHPSNVTWVEYTMEDMPAAYIDSHIVLVPTMYSEGTSLSCIEALATNNAVIASNVGGLPNLIVDGYNGRMISADYMELVEAIDELVDDRIKLALFAANGVLSAQAFSKIEWQRRWRDVISKTLESN
ncbi:glycosyltransferase [Caballeronia sp. LZ043]|uniref:glycosyltransferase n=1 Tax=Caballeronia sp. LZ043 TaxID=3038569 RepID=UPI002856E79E|nr:glycosyltransferase [Caballeronia sp. LZ043]MDR5826166.1 glycosyltransferase [Caballeronia sp. LZ043]